jgi:MFS transporter, MHS family, proline/betaine transporter
MPTVPRTSKKRVIIAGAIGNVMEWYDFAIYGYFASVIGKLFFPSEDPAVSLIAAFGAFAAGFLVRPIGGIVFGRIGDMVGRKRALMLSVLAMAVPTVLIGVLPTYASIGFAAPVLIVLLRMVQGLAVGGEYTTSVVFLVDHAPPGGRAFTSVWGSWGAVVGILFGSLVGSMVVDFLPVEAFESWGWRVPFLLGGLVAVVGMLLRRQLHTDVPPAEKTSPLRDTFGLHRMDVLRVILLNIGPGVTFYAAFVYAVSYMKTIDKLPKGIAFNNNTEAMAVILVLLPISAWLADRIGRKPMLIAGSAFVALGAMPLMNLMHSTDPSTVFLGELGFAFGFALMGGAVVVNVELMPRIVRCTGLAFAYNLAVGVFGGTTPLVATALIQSTGDPTSPAWWIAGAAAITLVTTILWVPETRDRALD